MNAYIYILISIVFIVLLTKWYIFERRKYYIRKYTFSLKVMQDFKNTYPALKDEEIKLIAQALLDYFKIINIVGKKFVAMPSQSVGTFWKVFTNDNNEYQKFCKKSFGRYLVYSEAEGIQKNSIASDGIQLVWEHSCLNEGIDPDYPTKIPMLFNLDSKLKIEKGFYYTKSNKRLNKSLNEYCIFNIVNMKRTQVDK